MAHPALIARYRRYAADPGEWRAHHPAHDAAPVIDMTRWAISHLTEPTGRGERARRHMAARA